MSGQSNGLVPDQRELERAALEHAKIPTALRRARSPLMRYIPDDRLPSPELRDLVQQITGHRCPCGGAVAGYVVPHGAEPT